MRDRRGNRDDRGVSITVNYVLGLSLSFIVVAGLVFAGSSFVEDQRETSIRTQLDVLGEQVASDISMADRLVQTSRSGTTVRVNRSLPSRVSGNSYRIIIEGGENPYLVLETEQPDVSVQVEFDNQTAVELDRTSGGPLVIEYTADELQVDSA